MDLNIGMYMCISAAPGYVVGARKLHLSCTDLEITMKRVSWYISVALHSNP